MRYLLALSLIWSSTAPAQSGLDERIVLGSKLARTVIIEAQSKDSLFFELCRYAPPASAHGPGHGHGSEQGHEIAASHLTDCGPIGPILPNDAAVRDVLEQRFIEALNVELQRLDASSYAWPIARATLGAGVLTGATFAGVEAAARQTLPKAPARPRDILTVFGFTGVLGAGLMLAYKLTEVREARYEQRRSKQIQKVIDLRIPPEPQLIDERLTSRAEARDVMHLFTRALTTATEQTRRAASGLTPATP